MGSSASATKVLIILDQRQERKIGLSADIEDVRKLFKQLKWKVIITENDRNTTLKKLDEHVNNLSEDIEFLTVCSVSDSPLNEWDIMNKFANVRCPQLKNKPKLFIFLTLQLPNEPEADSAASTNLDKHMMLVRVQISNPSNGSAFVQTLREKIQASSGNLDVQSILQAVKSHLRGKSEMCTIRENCFGNCNFS